VMSVLRPRAQRARVHARARFAREAHRFGTLRGRGGVPSSRRENGVVEGLAEEGTVSRSSDTIRSKI
jgi:hypothetical protein